MLNGKQKRFLRSLALNERAIFQLGKDGLSDNYIEQINNALGIFLHVYFCLFIHPAHSLQHPD